MTFYKIKEFALKNKYILAILALGLFLRLYEYKELFMYGHDQDLQGWFIRDVLENKHLRLIGQETSTQGMFIGSLFYYLLIPFYLLFGMDPIGGVFLTALIGLFTIWSFYFVFTKIFDEKTGLVGAFIYSISFYTVFNDREVVPTMPVILWTVWYLYGLWSTSKGENLKSMLLLGLLIGLIWHLNMALVIVLPLALLAIFFSNKKPDVKSYIYSAFVFVGTSLPLFLFELRHGFSQTKYLFGSVTTNQHDIVSGWDKVVRTFHLLSKDFSGIIWGDYFELKYEYVTWIFFGIFATLIIKNKIEKKISVLIGSWVLIYLAFFSLYSKIVSEYYLNGSLVVFIAVLALALTTLLKNKKYSDFAKAFLILFTIVNLDRFITIPLNKSGYVEKNQVLDAIKANQIDKGYPCVSLSYITNPGYERGYRYFTWQKRIKVKPVSNEVPVYTIVFPLKPIFGTDMTFGAIGLIYPDHPKYNLEQINKSCEGEDFNLIDSMIGFTS